MRKVIAGAVVSKSRTSDFLWVFRKAKCFLLWMTMIVISAFLPQLKWQFLISALIMGIRWAALSEPRQIHITILKGGEETWI
jgi:hypothetical protein